MSQPLTPLSRWPAGIAQAATPANDNSLRVEIFSTNGVADDVTAQPSFTSPDDDGKWYIIPASATGTSWATFAENSIAIFYGGTWYEFVPAYGNRVSCAGVLQIFEQGSPDAWVPITVSGSVSWGGISGALDDQTDLAEALDEVTIITEASAFTIVPATHAGRRRYIRAGGDVTFDSAEAMAAGQVYTIRATGTIDLLEDGVTLTPPSGGTLEMTVGMAVTVIMTSGTAGDVIGQTVPA